MEFMDVSEMASMGGRARADKMTPEERSESARVAVQARWAKEKARRKATEKTKKKRAGKKARRSGRSPD